MNHTLERVARCQFLNAKKLAAFARKPENFDRFGLIASGSDITVSTWHVDGLINAYKKTQSEEVLKADREQALRDSSHAAARQCKDVYSRVRVAE